MNKLENYFNKMQTYQEALAKDKQRKAKELVKTAMKCFLKGQITGMQLGLIAYKNNQPAF